MEQACTIISHPEGKIHLTVIGDIALCGVAVAKQVTMPRDAFGACGTCFRLSRDRKRQLKHDELLRHAYAAERG